MPKVVNDPTKAPPVALAPEPVEGDLPISNLGDEEDFINALWFGKGGTGKTTAMAALANLGPIVVINAEGGLKKRPLERAGIKTDNIQVVNLSQVAKDHGNVYATLESLFWHIAERLDDDPRSVAGVMWDSATEIHKVLVRESVDARVATAERTGRGSTDPFFIDRSDYWNVSERMRILIRRFRDLPCHFGTSALERRDVDDDSGKVSYGPALSPAIATDLFGYVDMVVHTTVEENNGEARYWGSFAPFGKYEGKDRFAAIPGAKLVDPWFDRIVGYVGDELTAQNDPTMIAVAEQAAAKAAATTTTTTTTEGK